METKQRAVENLFKESKKAVKGKPAYKAWIPIPVYYPMKKKKQITQIRPATAFMQQ
jgi:hypothetical protein